MLLNYNWFLLKTKIQIKFEFLKKKKISSSRTNARIMISKMTEIIHLLKFLFQQLSCSVISPSIVRENKMENLLWLLSECNKNGSFSFLTPYFFLFENYETSLSLLISFFLFCFHLQILKLLNIYLLSFCSQLFPLSLFPNDFYCKIPWKESKSSSLWYLFSFFLLFREFQKRILYAYQLVKLLLFILVKYISLLLAPPLLLFLL